MSSSRDVPILRFDDVLGCVKQELLSLPGHRLAAGIIVRDLYGRIRVIFPEPDLPSDKRLAKRLHQRLQGYSPGESSILLYYKDLFAPDSVLSSSNLVPAWESGPKFLDRMLVGNDWLREASHFELQTPTRVALHGIKGGVGRSTAGAAWAEYLARLGRRVLVLDLDLESPGIGATLLPPDQRPTYGLVDWFVERSVNQKPETILPDLVATSPLSGDRGGVIRVVPATSQNPENYIAKLARCYIGTRDAGAVLTFSEVIKEFLREIESLEKPDVVIMDSRSGLHDIAAAAITQLNAISLLFAVDSHQTWEAYRSLFLYWQRYHSWSRTSSDLDLDFRHNLKMVAALVPEIKPEDYLQHFRIKSYDLWSELYEESAEGEQSAFNFDLDFADAPHYPLVIRWQRGAREFDNYLRSPSFDESIVERAFGDFLRGATLLAIPEANV